MNAAPGRPKQVRTAACRAKVFLYAAPRRPQQARTVARRVKVFL